MDLPRKAAIALACVALGVLTGCVESDNANGKHPDILAIMGVGAHVGYAVDLDGTFVGQLDPLPELSWIDRLVLRAANALGILDVDPELELPDITMLKVEIQGIEPGQHTVSIHLHDETVQSTTFSYPDGLTDGILIITVDEEAFAKEFFSEPQADQQSVDQEP
jgi:hypothetical protein